MAGPINGLQINGLGDPRELPEPVNNYMRSNGAALLVAAVDAVDQQQQQSATVPGKRGQFYCDQCNMVFGSKSAHTSHMKSHMKYSAAAAASTAANGNGNGPQSSQGTFGGAAAPNPSADPYQCDKCNKTFAVPARLVSFNE